MLIFSSSDKCVYAGLMRTLRYLSKAFVRILLLVPIYHLSALVKRNRRLWIVSSSYGLADNSKYFYILYSNILRDKYGVDLVWVSKTRKTMRSVRRLNVGGCVHMYSLQGLYFLLTAGVYIYSHGIISDLPLCMSKTAKHVYLWHGIPIKKIGFLDEKDMLNRLLRKLLHKSIYPYVFIKPDIVLSTSSFVSNYFSECFSIDSDQCIVSAYPRCEVLKYVEDDIFRFITRYEGNDYKNFFMKMKTYSQVILYMPTWRDNNPDFLKHIGFDWNELDKKLSMKNSLFILKVHPASNVPDLRGMKNVIVLDHESDIYPILPATNVLITDYSSIYFDYLLCGNKEIVLFPIDYKEYIDNCRGLALDYDKYMPGYRVDDFQSLLTLIENYFILDKKYSCERAKVRRILWDDIHNSEPLIDCIIEKCCV